MEVKNVGLDVAKKKIIRRMEGLQSLLRDNRNVQRLQTVAIGNNTESNGAVNGQYHGYKQQMDALTWDEAKMVAQMDELGSLVDWIEEQMEDANA